MIHEKKINRGGGITIPSDLRRSYGIEPGDRIGVEMQDGGDILLRRTNGSCLFCGTGDALIRYKGRFICKACLAEMQKGDIDHDRD